MICFEKHLFDKKEKLTKYDTNYIFKKSFNKTHTNKNNNLSKAHRKSLIKNTIGAVNLKRIGGIIDNSYEHSRNQRDYEKLQRNIEKVEMERN